MRDRGFFRYPGWIVHAIEFGLRGKPKFLAVFLGSARSAPQVIGVFADDVFRDFHVLFLLATPAR